MIETLAISAFVLLAAQIAFSFYAIRAVKGSGDAERASNEKYLTEYSIANRLSEDVIKFADENKRFKQTITYLEVQNADLSKKVIAADPGAAISNSMRGFKPPGSGSPS